MTGISGVSGTATAILPLALRPNLGQAVQKTGQAIAYGLSDVMQKPQLLKQEALIYAMLVLVDSRTLIAWLSARKAKDPKQRELRFREAVRTTLREQGGFALSYMLLRAVQKQVDKLLTRLMRIQHSPVPAIGLQRIGQDIGHIFQNLKNGQPLPTLTPSSIEALEASPAVHYDSHSPIGQWLTQLTQHPAFARLDPVKTMGRMHQVLPILVGSLFSVGMSGFWLENFALNHSESVVNGITAHRRRLQKRHKTAMGKNHSVKANGREGPSNVKPGGYNVREFMGSIMEERWRRSQVITPGFGQQNLPEST